MFSEKIAKSENNKLDDFSGVLILEYLRSIAIEKPLNLLKKTFRNVERWSGTSLKFL